MKIVDEQDGFLSLEGHKISGPADVLDYHRTQCLNYSHPASSQSGVGAAVLSSVKAANRSKSSAAAAAHNGENCEKPIR